MTRWLLWVAGVLFTIWCALADVEPVVVLANVVLDVILLFECMRQK